MGTGLQARGWRAGAARPRRRGDGFYVGIAALVMLLIAAAFLALVVLAMLGGFLEQAGGCETGEGVSIPLGSGSVVAATVYSGSGPGAYGAGLAGHYAFAELGLWSEADSDRAHANRIGVALGLGHALAPFTQLDIRAPNGRSVIAEKLDVGMGGPPIDGHRRAIDLWTATREALQLPPDWSGLVRIEAGPGGVIGTEGDAPVGAHNPSPTGLPSLSAPGGECALGADLPSATRQRIVQIARTQLGVGEQPAGSDCTAYGPCEPWCALFITWVWRQGGVAIPSQGFSGGVYDWAAQHAHVYPPSASPQPGWAALFGSGPTDPATSLHVAIVESVLPDGEITLINGNFAGSVMRTGPCQATGAELPGAGGCEEPGPIYAYASPE